MFRGPANAEVNVTGTVTVKTFPEPVTLKPLPLMVQLGLATDARAPGANACQELVLSRKRYSSLAERL